MTDEIKDAAYVLESVIREDEQERVRSRLLDIASAVANEQHSVGWTGRWFGHNWPRYRAARAVVNALHEWKP